ncbi:MAG: Sapep family Mn(2+)-dependent dipeptidase, partial [Clostridia bacterium]
IVGRGIADDKGSAIVALHCLRVLKDEGVIGKRKLRVVMGSGEEVGMKDMVYYFDKEQKPTIGFTPDSEYGVCNCEKGHIIFKVTNKNESSIVKTFDAGTVVNAVPYKAEAVLSLSKEESEILENATKVHEGDFEICAIGDDIKVISHGTAAHASTPEHGKNAASLLIDLLYKVFGEKIGKTLVFAKDKIGLSYDGSNFSMKCSEEYSGDLTLNLGIVKVDSEKAEISVDIRFPKNKKYAEFKGIIENAVSEYGLELEKISGEEAIYISADCPLVEMLTGAYKDITGEECDVFAMGGGTYAKAMGGKGVAFGPSFQDDETHIHDCNEKINLEKFKIHAQICLESMYRMFTIDEV